MTNLQLTIAAVGLVFAIFLVEHLLGDLAARVHTLEMQAREAQP